MKKLPYPRQVAMEALFTGHGPTTFKGKEHNLSRAYLVELFLENAIMPDVILDGSNLQKAWLTGSDLSGVRLVQADLREANLSRVNLQNSLLRNTSFINASLQGADLRGADMAHAKLQGAALEGARLDGANQLAGVASLYEATGLPVEIASDLMKRRPHLFRKPENPDDDPDYIFERQE